jgi:hypothetical protein
VPHPPALGHHFGETMRCRNPRLLRLASTRSRGESSGMANWFPSRCRRSYRVHLKRPQPCTCVYFWAPPTKQTPYESTTSDELEAKKRHTADRERRYRKRNRAKLRKQERERYRRKRLGK